MFFGVVFFLCLLLYILIHDGVRFIFTVRCMDSQTTHKPIISSYTAKIILSGCHSHLRDIDWPSLWVVRLLYIIHVIIIYKGLKTTAVKETFYYMQWHKSVVNTIVISLFFIHTYNDVSGFRRSRLWVGVGVCVGVGVNTFLVSIHVCYLMYSVYIPPCPFKC